MLTREELARLRKYHDLIAFSGGRVDILTREEQQDMQRLLGKWLEQAEEGHGSGSTTMTREELRKMPIWLQARTRAQEFVDRLLAGSEHVEFEGLRIPVPRWVSRIRWNPDAEEMPREKAIETVARTSWAEGWARGMLSTFYEGFETLREEEKRKLVEEWARKLAERVLRGAL